MNRENILVQNNNLNIDSNKSISILRNNRNNYIGLDLPNENFSIYFLLDSNLGVTDPNITLFSFKNTFSTKCFDKRLILIDFAADNFNITQYGSKILNTESGLVNINATVLIELGYGISIGLTNNNLIYDNLVTDQNDVQDKTEVSGSNQYADEDFDITEGSPTTGGFITFKSNLLSLKGTFSYNENFYLQASHEDRNNMYKLSYNNYNWIPNKNDAGDTNTKGTEKNLTLLNFKFLSEIKGIDYTLSSGYAEVTTFGSKIPYSIDLVYENTLNKIENFAYYIKMSIFDSFNPHQAHNNNTTSGFIKGSSLYTEFIFKNNIYYEIGGFLSYKNNNSLQVSIPNGNIITPPSPDILLFGINFSFSRIQFSYARVNDRNNNGATSENNEEILIKLCGF